MTTSRPLTQSQIQALSALPENEDSQFPVLFEKLSADRYISQARWEEELDAVFRSVPLVAATSANLPSPRTYMQRTLVGVPLLLTRDAAGKVHAFANACRHRGMQLCVEDTVVSAPRIVCPYHAWTYALDGALVGVPRQEIFDGLDRGEYALKELPCLEAGGLIWVGVDPARDYDFGVIEGQLKDEFDAMGIGAMRIYDSKLYPVGANWKLVMDTMLDSYHVTRLHKDSLAPFFVDVENHIDLIGPHIRSASARGNFRRDKVTGDFNQTRRISVFSYVLFPNTIVVVSPRFMSVAVVRPTAVDHCDIEYMMLIDDEPVDADADMRLRQSFDLMDMAFGKEDFWAAEMCHRGLASGMLDEVTLGGMEKQMLCLHQAVDACLAKARG